MSNGFNRRSQDSTRRARLIPAENEKKPRIVIIGGGIAGLTVAHELVMASRDSNSDCEFDILILEKNPVVGGKARTKWDEQKAFSEHSMRVLPGSYVCMHQIMKEIPRKNGTVIDCLTPVTINMKHGDRQFTIQGDYRTRFLGSIKYVRDVIGLLWYLTRIGVRIRELYVFLGKVLRLLFLPSRRVTEDLSRLKFSEYVGGEDGKQGRFDMVYRIAEILVAAKSHSSAGVVSQTLLEWFVTPFLKGQHVRNAVSEFSASTSDALINPWIAFLENNNVRFENALVDEVDAGSGKVQEIRLEDGRRVPGDVFVLAVQHNIADAVIGKGLRRYLPGLADFPKLGEEWAHSVQFQLPKLPDELAKLGSTSIATLDSPWSIAYRVYSKSTWEDDWHGDSDGAVFTATISNTKRAGVVHWLPFLRCTPDQILEEVVTQTGLSKVLDISQGSLGLDLKVMSESDAEEKKQKGYAVTAIGPSDDRVFVTDAQMYIRLPGNLDIEPDNETGVYNFFLAGEYTRTKYRIPTMEKSCESGKRCAKAIIAGLGCGVPREVPQYSMPFAFVRSESFFMLSRRALWLAIIASIIWLIVKQF